MTREEEERHARVVANKPRYDIAHLLRKHVFRSSRPWPDGSRPTGPDWNPGCSCGEGMYYFEHDLHVADVLLAAGYVRVDPPKESGQPEGV